MLRSRRFVIAGLLFVLVAVVLPSFASPRSASAVTSPALPYSAYAAGPYTVRGNTIFDTQNRPYYFHGVARDGLEFSCKGDTYLTPRYLALLGPAISSMSGVFWYGNTARLPVSEAFWLHGQPQQHCSALQYQMLVRKTLDTLRLFRLNVILDLQWTDAGGQGGGGSWQMPDADSLTFWRQAATLYKNYPNVLFELYNEPHPYASTGDPWSCWLSGCQVVNDSTNDFYCRCHQSFNYRAVGMQALVDAIRSTGANNLILVGGLNWGFDLSELPTHTISGPNIVYDTHPYPYQGKLTVSDWEASFGNLSAIYPIISAESGEYDCKSAFMGQLIPYLDAHRISWIGWAWYAGGAPCSFPELITNYDGEPASAMGTYIYHALLAYAGVAPRTSFHETGPGVGPASKRWYFPGEPLGDGFSQALILDNPSMQACAVTVQYLLQPSPGAPLTKMIALKLDALGRVTSQVNNDVNIPAAGPGSLVAEIVTVDNGATPDCPGIVAERAVHLNSEGIASGNAMAGLTQTGTTFFFADVPTSKDGSATSVLSLLNPGRFPAKVSVQYFAGGRQVGTQSATLPAQASSQLTPPAGLPSHVGAIITADQPLAAMRATLLRNVASDSSGAISGFTEVAGVVQAASDWFFAEGYTGAGFQESLVMLNPANKGANLTLTLQYASGATGVFHLSVAARSQVIWDVNAHAARAGISTASLSLAVSSNTPVVAERVMAFHYQLNGEQVVGATDVTGLPGPAVASVYSFADGYLRAGFAEWLTLQNMTAKRELITITLIHAGQPYVYQVYLPARGRGTISIGQLLQLLGQDLSGPAGYDVSLVVQSDGGAFVAERPMYWNMDGDQGGSDVIGYGGK